MEEYDDLHDWELVPDYDTCDGRRAVRIQEEDAAGGVIKSDYFALGSVGGSFCVKSEENDEFGDESDNPTWVEPHSESMLLETSGGQSEVVEGELPYSGAVCTDESSGGGMFFSDEQKLDRGSSGDFLTETASEGTDSGFEKFGGESEDNDNSGEQQIMIAVTGGASFSENEKEKKFRWRMRWDLLWFYLRVRPVWSVSIAASMVGIVILWRKLHRSKRKTRGVPLRIALDDKNVPQLATSAMRLNHAVSVVRRMPIVRPFLPAGSGAQWAAPPLR